MLIPKPQDSTSTISRPNIFLYVPNLIGYTRVALLLMSAYFLRWNPAAFGVTHFLSFFLDYFDGIAARALGQCSSFGHHLDTITDIFGYSLLYFAFGLTSSAEWALPLASLLFC